MDFQTYVINFKGYDKSYMNTVSINLDLSWSEAKLLKIQRIACFPITLTNLLMSAIVINSNIGYTIISNAHTNSSTITKELMRFSIFGESSSGWFNPSSDGDFVVPTGMSTLTLWLTDINGIALELTPAEQSQFQLYIVLRVYG